MGFTDALTFLYRRQCSHCGGRMAVVSLQVCLCSGGTECFFLKSQVLQSCLQQGEAACQLSEGSKLQNTNHGYSFKMKIPRLAVFQPSFRHAHLFCQQGSHWGSQGAQRASSILWAWQGDSHEENVQNFLIQPLQGSTHQDYFPTLLSLTPGKERPKPTFRKIHGYNLERT